MNGSQEGSGVGVQWRWHVAPFLALLLLITVSQAQAQFVQTHHVRREVSSGQAKFLNRLPGN